MTEEKNSSKTIEQDNIKVEPTDALVNLIRSVVERFQTNSEEDKIEKLTPILQDLRDKLRDQTQLNREIYRELESLQNESLRRALLTPVISIYNLMEENLDYIINKMPQEYENNEEGKLSKVIELFIFIKKRFEEMLIHNHGLRAITPIEDDLFNPNEHYIVRTESTGEVALNDTIFRLEKTGFKDTRNNAMFKRAEVITMIYQEECQSDDNNSIND